LDKVETTKNFRFHGGGGIMFQREKKGHSKKRVGKQKKKGGVESGEGKVTWIVKRENGSKGGKSEKPLSV